MCQLDDSCLAYPLKAHTVPVSLSSAEYSTMRGGYVASETKEMNATRQPWLARQGEFLVRSFM